MKTFRSNGKLLLTSEYVVLDGAKALALPTKFGQSLSISPNNEGNISWQSYDENNAIWFEAFLPLNLNDLDASEPKDEVSTRLLEILSAAQKLNPDFLKEPNGFEITTHQDFNRKWGLGTSSTLINNIATWAKIDAYQLLDLTFGGSGYDIACAQHDHPIMYQLLLENNPEVTEIVFDPPFKDQLFFIYLNKKQNSREGIKTYKALRQNSSDSFERFNTITESLIDCRSLSEFEALVTEHESLVSELIEQPPIKSQLFEDFNGAIKSLGAWGGDFILATSINNPRDYFNAKGYDTILSYADMIK